MDQSDDRATAMPRVHLPGRSACPRLPVVHEVLTAEVTRRFGRCHDARFYHAALCYAQSLWLEGKPAQAMLQLNKAFFAELDGGEAVLQDWPLPYAAKRWIMEHCPADEFLGNPVRHYQHLATRMSGPQPELRRWRAWSCFHLAQAVLPPDRYPRDEEQISREDIAIPDRGETLRMLAAHGLPGEDVLVAEILETGPETVV